MNLWKRISIYFTALIFSAVGLTLTGLGVLSPVADPTDTHNQETYTPPPPKDICVLFGFEEEETNLFIVNIRYSDMKIDVKNVTDTAAEELVSKGNYDAAAEICGKNVSLEEHRFFIIDRENFIHCVDNTNGLLYTNHNEIIFTFGGANSVLPAGSHHLNGEVMYNVLCSDKNPEENCRLLTAFLISKLWGNEFETFSNQFITALDTAVTNISYAQWASCSKPLQKIAENQTNHIIS